MGLILCYIATQKDEYTNMEFICAVGLMVVAIVVMSFGMILALCRSRKFVNINEDTKKLVKEFCEGWTKDEMNKAAISPMNSTFLVIKPEEEYRWICLERKRVK